jgi:hypothetical protein
VLAQMHRVSLGGAHQLLRAASPTSTADEPPQRTRSQKSR